ncbi:amino acid synthesis family protein [Lacisediminihabitans changchengi]|uniref:Amino acid synthesis family protein n=1 Tax=Lacisediminihabitans changchengi TaxID=2787634 RepID=A0A934W3D0_9MICO|nr:amino acid synthesis family protein [Lacisediminihabitans changchengi]MBK4348828.1 amino acid synthesis family protein [Lacisediminihabitans changchengi]
MRIRKVIAYCDEVLAERGEPVARPLRRGVAAAIIPNPWLATDTRADLAPVVESIAAPLALLLTAYLTKLVGPPARIEAFGKAAIVGLSGEMEHGAALLHTPFFGNIIRERFDATDYISFADAQGAPGTSLVVPMAHKNDGGLRAYFESVPLQIDDAPEADEIVVAVAAADGPRPNQRIGDRTTDRRVRLSEYADHYLIGGEIP